MLRNIMLSGFYLFKEIITYVKINSNLKNQRRKPTLSTATLLALDRALLTV